MERKLTTRNKSLPVLSNEQLGGSDAESDFRTVLFKQTDLARAIRDDKDLRETSSADESEFRFGCNEHAVGAYTSIEERLLVSR
jgi:hypothetical protein